MAKSSGGSRNYKGTPTAQKRKSEYKELMSKGEYKGGYYSSSGGFYVLHKDHNEISHQNGDYSDVASRKLAKKGYKIYLQSELSTIDGQKVFDGYLYSTAVDFKTISKAGKNTIKNSLENAAKQGADTVVLYQRTKYMTRDYVESQLDLFVSKSPKRAREKIKNVVVVGLSGNVHRHKL